MPHVDAEGDLADAAPSPQEERRVDGDERAVPVARSKALEVNLARTAVPVVIPADHEVLLEVTREYRGIHESTRRLLYEINHEFVGWADTLAELHRRALGDFSYHVVHARAAEAVAVLFSLYARAVASATPASLRETAARNALAYAEKIVRASGEHLERMLDPLDAGLARLADAWGEAGCTGVPARASAPLGRLVEALDGVAPGSAAAARARDLLCGSLDRVYAAWLEREDPRSWLDPEAPDAALAAVASIGHEELAAHRASLAALDPTAADSGAMLCALPDEGEIERMYLEVASQLHDRSARVHWLVRVLSQDVLVALHESAVSELSHLASDLIARSSPSEVEQFVHAVFSALRGSAIFTSHGAMSLVARLGSEVMRGGDPEACKTLVEEILACDFPTPEFSGFSDEWQIQVNPAHLRAIRTYLEVIEANPAQARELVAALVIQLRIGGVLVADTDLFQRDVSKLLNSGIDPIFHPVKHLLRLFPVYFDEIGAEGDLRDVSSRLDEIEGRRDALCHFLRKQCHVESNPRLVDFIEAVASFWATGDRELLRSFVPAPLFAALASDPAREGMGAVIQELVGGGLWTQLLESSPEAIEERLASVAVGRPAEREKVGLLFRLRRLVVRKYGFDHEDLIGRLSAFGRLDPIEIERLRGALAEDQIEEALDATLGILETLKRLMTSRQRTEGVEDIYRKRHIAVGIPSLYGRYQEEKFDAAGLTFRTGSLANVLFERLLDFHQVDCIHRAKLRRVAGWLRQMLRALRIDGAKGRGLSMGLSMLEQSLAVEGTTVDQYLNVFQVLSRSVEQLIRIRYLEVYENALERILPRFVKSGVLTREPGNSEEEIVMKTSEQFLRELIARSLGLQQLDMLLGRVVRSLVQVRETLSRETLELLMSYEPEGACVPIEAADHPLDGPIHLGNKGYLVKRLASDGLPVPPGFILTTEIFRCVKAIRAWPNLRREVEGELLCQIDRLERLTGLVLGDPERPLLLSVRSGSAISMPGMLDTFLNVGINEEIAAGFAARSGSPWGAWDAYRRFLQLWGMGHGLERDDFDALMRDSKIDFGAEKKANLSAGQMREVALRYRQLLRDRRVEIVDDPWPQILRCVDLVLDSWHSAKAQVYRRELQIAEEWGTAVVIQSMVYGNLHERSGTGVVLTTDPRHSSAEVRLHGDFIVQAQGDDVVSGLVETYPVSEEQRLTESPGATVSLEKDFPKLYDALLHHARTLIHDHGMFPQEIEFTFEGDDPADLYILQIRDTVMSQVASVLAFVPSEALAKAWLATGIGAGGGALSGRVAHNIEDVELLRRRFPDDHIILLRPDTVPDDLPLLVEADAMVTAIGGSTSHAAVAAQRLGRTCVVGCRELSVDERARRSVLAGRVLETGDLLSINGVDGSVYLGRHPSTLVRRQRLA
jgi:pyruvate,orthophosphate dikinase